jgi:uncharacterized sodium:solute symporter family permease YidK
MFNNIIIIAADFGGSIGKTSFWDTGLGNILKTAMGVVGILVVVYAVLKGVKNVASGKVADAVKGIIGAVMLAAVLFNPTLIENAIKAGGKVINAAIETVASIGDSANTGTPTTPTTPGATTPPATTAPAAPTPPASTTN